MCLQWLCFRKKSKKYFPSSENRVKEIINLIDSDVCGPMSVKFLGGASYYVSLIDDYLRKTWVYLMKTKNELFDRFKKFQAQIENLLGKKIKILKYDNGGEFTSKEMIFVKKQELRGS